MYYREIRKALEEALQAPRMVKAQLLQHFADFDSSQRKKSLHEKLTWVPFSLEPLGGPCVRCDAVLIGLLLSVYAKKPEITSSLAVK